MPAPMSLSICLQTTRKFSSMDQTTSGEYTVRFLMAALGPNVAHICVRDGNLNKKSETVMHDFESTNTRDA